jgi:D-lyxose ketol-isomerase
MNTQKPGVFYRVCKSSVFTVHKTYFISITKTSQFMLFREKIIIYFENHTEPIHALSGQNAQIFNVKAGGVNAVLHRVKLHQY